MALHVNKVCATIPGMPVSPIRFIAETQDELKKVTWPTQQEVIRLTMAIIIISVIVGFFIGGLDFGLTKLMETILK